MFLVKFNHDLCGKTVNNNDDLFLGTNSIQVVSGIRLSADETVLSTDMVHGSTSCDIHRYHYNGGSCPLC